MTTPTSLAPAATTAKDLRRAGWGAIAAAAAVIVVPVFVFGGIALGAPDPTANGSAAFYDPAGNSSWANGLWGVLGLVSVFGIAVLVIGVRRSLVPGMLRDLGSIAAILWIVGLTLNACSSMVEYTPALTPAWNEVSSDVAIRGASGLAITVIEWCFLAVSVFGAFFWTLAFVAGGRGTIVGLASGIPAGLISAVAAVLASLGVIPPATTFAQIVLLLLLGIPLLRRARSLRY